MALSEQSLRTYLADDLQVDLNGVNPTSPLFSSGLIDSFALINLITFIEKACGITISAEETTLDNLDTIERILTFGNRAR